MTRIIHFGKYYLPETGGIESVTASLARGASDAGHHVGVICFRKMPASDDEVIDGVNVFRAPIAGLIASQPLGAKYVWLCLKEAQTADLIHLHVPNMLGALCCLMAGKRPRVLVHWHSDVVGKGWLGKAFKPLETALLKRAEAIVATSDVYAKASKPLKPFQHKVTIVPPGVRDAPTTGSADVESAELPSELQAWLRARKLILTVGRLVAYKGFDTLIRAATHLREDAAVVIVGDGFLRKSLQADIDRAGLTQRVPLAGRLSDGALHALFTQA